ncbi:MAG: sulfite exporter TauE/SafE family protein [Anaerolinea sp.]|nr:sulfite exporter TauE/SafE family protein [Anaerolinea sp.]
MNTGVVAVIVFFAIFIQAISGSGLALVAMPLLIGILPTVEAASLVSLMSITTQAIMISRYYRSLSFNGLWRLVLGALVGIPIGIIALSQLDERLILTVLGVILVGYSLYSLFAPKIPEIKNQNWGYLFGLFSGLLHGAYNTGGPPYVIYGVSQRWNLPTFKCNLQVLLMVNSASVVIGHLVAGHFTSNVLQNYLVAFPMIVLGAGAGFFLDRYIDEKAFKRIVLVVLLVIGIKMLLP